MHGEDISKAWLVAGLNRMHLDMTSSNIMRLSPRLVRRCACRTDDIETWAAAMATSTPGCGRTGHWSALCSRCSYWPWWTEFLVREESIQGNSGWCLRERLSDHDWTTRCEAMHLVVVS